MSRRQSSRIDDNSRMYQMNQTLSGTAGRRFGIKLSANREHAWFQVRHEGKLYVFNGNDGLDGIGSGEYGPEADGSIVPKAIRPLMDRESKILQHIGGLCYMVAVALSKAYQNMDWDRFIDFAMICTEKDLYLYNLNN